MRTNELMIGDLVMYKDEACYIFSIEHFGNLVGVDNEKICDLIDAKETNPISLTEEVLKKNGFIQNIYNHLILRIDGELAFCITQKLGHFWLPICSYGKGMVLNYVHELQHALRLCGLNELADNFKV